MDLVGLVERVARLTRDLNTMELVGLIVRVGGRLIYLGPGSLGTVHLFCTEVAQFYLTQRIIQVVLESERHHEIVELLFTLTD